MGGGERGAAWGFPTKATGRRRISLFILLAVSCPLAGCTTVRVTADLNYPHEQVRKVAVLDFDQEPIEVQIRDKLVWGRIEYRQAGRQVGDIVSRALAMGSLYEVYDRTALRALMRKKNLDEAQLARQLDVNALRGLLGVDAIVMGRIEAFGYSFVCLYQRAWARYSTRCVDLQDGSVIWELEGSTTRLYADESRLAARIAEAGVKKLRREMEFSALIRKASQPK